MKKIYNPHFDRRKPEEPARDEWQVDEYGRRFRKIGDVKEYEMVYRIDGIEVPASQLEDFNRRQAEAAKARIEADKAKPTEPKGLCPFKRGRNNLHVGCERDCAFYGGTSCVLAVTISQPARDTQGMKCPIAGTCGTSCALYAGGCKFIELLKGV